MNRNDRKNKKHVPHKASTRTKLRVQEKDLELSLIKTYPNQVVWEVWLPATPKKFTTTVTTGVIAGAVPVASSGITDFATRFGTTFVEYRIVRARFRIRFFSSTNPGVCQFWIDEKSTSNPTLTEALERAVLVCSAAAIDTAPMLKWMSGDPLDLQYSAIGTDVSYSTFKVYTSNTSFGSSVVATDYLEVEPLFQVQFRGLQGS